MDAIFQFKMIFLRYVVFGISFFVHKVDCWSLNWDQGGVNQTRLWQLEISDIFSNNNYTQPNGLSAVWLQNNLFSFENIFFSCFLSCKYEQGILWRSTPGKWLGITCSKLFNLWSLVVNWKHSEKLKTMRNWKYSEKLKTQWETENTEKLKTQWETENTVRNWKYSEKLKTQWEN